MPDIKKINTLLQLICEIVNEDGPWQQKRYAVTNEASPDELTALEEFTAWFEPESSNG